MSTEAETRTRLIKEYAELALANLREAGGKTPTTEMLAIQQQLQMSHDQIMSTHATASLARI